MNTNKRYRFPPDIISYAVRLYFRFNLSHRDIEDLLAQRGIIVSYESIRLWCIRFGRKYTERLKRRHQGHGDTFLIDEIFVKINGKQHYPWRAVDTAQYANNRAELSHQPTRVRERVMRRIKSTAQAQRFLTVHAAVYNLFNLGRHLVSAEHYRKLRTDAFGQWTMAVACF